MTPEQNQPKTESSGLQFEKAEFNQGALQCAVCKTPIVGQFYQINGQNVCPSCRTQADTELGGGNPASRFLMALVAGLGAAAVGIFVYWAVTEITHAQWSIIAILVGWMVGYAVRWGSRAKGGIKYQLLAVVLTYCAIAAHYVPYLIPRKAELMDYIQGFAEALAVPWTAGPSNIIVWIIIAIGLQQAWSMNRDIKLQITGPFSTGQSTPPAAT